MSAASLQAAQALKAGAAAGKASRAMKASQEGQNPAAEASRPVELELPWAPSVNHCWARNRDGGMRLTDAGKEFRLSVQLVVNRAKVSKMAGRLSVEIIACPPDKRRRDIDNLVKAVLDALQHADLYDDDNQIDDLRICRAAPRIGGSLFVRIAVRELP